MTKGQKGILWLGVALTIATVGVIYYKIKDEEEDREEFKEVTE